MCVWLKQSTAVTIKFGPGLDATDGVTPETGLATAMDNATTGIRISKNGGNYADRSDATVPVHDESGDYDIVLNATDTNTLGALRVMFEDSTTNLPIWADFMVVPANVWDSLFGADNLDVNVAQWLGTAAATPTVAGVPEVDLTHVGGATTNVAALATNVDAVLTDTSTTLQAELDAIQAAVITNAAGADIAADIIAVKAETASILVDTGTTLDAAIATVDANVDAILVDTGTTLDAALAVVDANVDAILVDTGTTLPATLATIQDSLVQVQTTIATLASQTSFTLTAGSADDDAYNNCAVIIEDAATATQKAVGLILDYTGSTKTVTLAYDPGVFTMATTDKIIILAESAIQGRQAVSAIIPGVATGVPTTIAMAASGLSESSDDHYIGRTLIWTSGVLLGQQTDITDYTGASRTFAFTATTEACSAGDNFVIV